MAKKRLIMIHMLLANLIGICATEEANVSEKVSRNSSLYSHSNNSVNDFELESVDENQDFISLDSPSLLIKPIKDNNSHLSVGILQKEERSTKMASLTSNLKSSKIQSKLPVMSAVRSVSNSYTENEESLKLLLLSIIARDMKDCALVIAYEEEFEGSAALEALLMLSNPRQVVKASSADDLAGVVWESSRCRGYIFLQRYLNNLETFVSYSDQYWDFHGRYVLVGLSKEQLQILSTTKKISKTENLIGIVKFPRIGEFGVYANQVITTSGVIRVATWKHNGFPTPPPPTLFPDKLTDLQGAALTVVTFEWQPSVMYQRDEDGNVVNLYGRDVMVVKGLVEALNATLVYKDVPPGEFWGSNADNGSWNGLMGILQRGEADIGIANTFITNINNRMEAVDFSAPFDTEVTCFIARIPKPLPQWERILYPFQLTTWLTIFIGLAVSGPLLNALARAGIASEGEERELRSVSYSCLYTFGLHFKVSQPSLPSRRSTQLFISFLLLYIIIITTGYCSNLTAFLTVSRQPPAMDTIKELYESKLLVAGLTIFFRGTLVTSSNPFLKGLVERFVSYEDEADIWPDVLKGDIVYITNKRPVLYQIETLFTDNGIPKMRIFKETFSPYFIALATQKNSPLKRKFDIIINRMVEGGLVNYWFQESIRMAKQEEDKKKEKQKNQNSKSGSDLTETEDSINLGRETTANKDDQVNDNNVDEGVRSLKLNSVQGVFFILIVGYLVAFLVFLSELAFVKKH